MYDLQGYFFFVVFFGLLGFGFAAAFVFPLAGALAFAGVLAFAFPAIFLFVKK